MSDPWGHYTKLKTWLVKDATERNKYCVIYFLGNIRIATFIGTESRTGWERGGSGELVFSEYILLIWWWRCIKTRWKWWLHNVSVVNPTEPLQSDENSNVFISITVRKTIVHMHASSSLMTLLMARVLLFTWGMIVSFSCQLSWMSRSI